MSDELEVDGGSHAPIWAAFGDLMSVPGVPGMAQGRARVASSRR